MQSRERTSERSRNRHSLALGRWGTGRRLSRPVTALAVAALVGIAGQARSENECGPPDTGREVICSPSTYDPADGNIFYSHDEDGEDETGGDFTIRLTGDLSIEYDRERPGDDVHVDPGVPDIRSYGAVWITPGAFGAYTGDVSLYSSADVTSNARGIFAGHYGESGALRMQILGGNITTAGEAAHAIDGYRSSNNVGRLSIVVRGVAIDATGKYSSGVAAFHDGTNDIDMDVRDSSIAIGGEQSAGVLALHSGEGDIHLVAGDLAIHTEGVDADGIYALHRGTGDVGIDVRGSAIATSAGNADGVTGLHWGTGDLSLVVRGASIDTAGADASGVDGHHRADGQLRIDARTLDIDTAGVRAHGVLGWHQGKGRLTIDARDLTVATDGDDAYGVFGLLEDEGDLNIDARNLDIATSAGNADGVTGLHQGMGDLSLEIRGGSIDTAGDDAAGVYGHHRADGQLRIDARTLDIDTAGARAHGVFGRQQGKGRLTIDARDLTVATDGDDAYGVFGYLEDEGDLNIDARDLAVDTGAINGVGLIGGHLGEGDLNIDARNLDIDTAGETAHGVGAQHAGVGDLGLDVRGASIATAGENAVGVVAQHSGTGDLILDALDLTVLTAGDYAHGVAIIRFGSGSARIAVDGGSIRAAGPGANGVRIGRLNQDGSLEFAAEVGEDGYRRQSVSVNALVTGGSGKDAAGVFLAGGGRVSLGPRGSVGAASGVAIRASGGAPKLSVDMNLDGRRVGNVLGGAIRNDGGETTLAVNGVTLHEGAKGVTGAGAANGAWDVTVSASEAIAGRTFTPGDFVETYAPRAAVYEALPGFLLRLGNGRPTGRRVTQPGSPVWAQVSGGRGSFKPGRASAGAEYELSRVSVEAGLDLALSETVTGSLSLRHVSGAAEVTSPHGGGEIEAEGLGAAAAVSWSGTDGYYGRGRLAFTNYDVDLSSRQRGSLARDVEASGYSLGIEAGRRIAFGETATLTPRVWVMRRSLSGSAFTDAVGSRVSLDEATRNTGGLGLSAETARTLEGGTLALSASADIERALGGTETATGVSGERLESEGSNTRILLGLGGTWRNGRFSLGVQVAADGPGTDDASYFGRVGLGWKF